MVRERRYYVYIMASKSRVIYVGMTGFLMARVLRHKAGEGGAFTPKYRVHRLVYFHSFQNVGDAIARETAIKNCPTQAKSRLEWGHPRSLCKTQYPITSMPSSGSVRRLLAYNVSKKRQTVSKLLSPR